MGDDRKIQKRGIKSMIPGQLARLKKDVSDVITREAKFNIDDGDIVGRVNPSDVFLVIQTITLIEYEAKREYSLIAHSGYAGWILTNNFEIVI